MSAELTTLMTVGDLSRRTRVPIKALRAYTDWGLINTLGRNGANYRLYDADALRCVQIITELRGLGLTLADPRRRPDRPAGTDPPPHRRVRSRPPRRTRRPARRRTLGRRPAALRQLRLTLRG